ncbi:unnamed protein product [Peniophora sp. CBMAI 1063]|nr:unnamed protein product [Peniophora sp. CBMAI 1063]
MKSSTPIWLPSSGKRDTPHIWLRIRDSSTKWRICRSALCGRNLHYSSTKSGLGFLYRLDSWQAVVGLVPYFVNIQ